MSNNGLHNIREYLSYDQDTGAFTWIKRPAHTRIQVGDAAGSLDSDGYLRIKFGGIEYRAGRLAWFFVTGQMPPDDLHVDHRNLSKTDNRFDNLRLATVSQNNRNRAALPRENRHSRYKGVSRFKSTGKWMASIYVNGKLRFLGTFRNEEDAARAYDEAANQHFGEFSRTNFGAAFLCPKT